MVNAYFFPFTFLSFRLLSSLLSLFNEEPSFACYCYHLKVGNNYALVKEKMIFVSFFFKRAFQLVTHPLNGTYHSTNLLQINI